MNLDEIERAKRRKTKESISMSSPVSTPILHRSSFIPSTPQSVTRKLTFTNLQSGPPGENIQVFARVRPFTQEEDKTNEVNCISYASGSLLSIKSPKAPFDESKYTFTSVFPPDTRQDDLFKSTALPLVESFLQGHNGLLFAYGITNAGKTYTITGKTNDTEEKGILPRMLDVIFNSINPQENQIKNGDGVVAKVPMDPNMTHWIWLTYYEIYNDKIIDLLNVANQKKLPLKLKDENGKAGGKVNEVAVKTRKEAEECINLGMKSRSVASTALNGDSSRSHAMLTIRLFQYTDPKDPNSSPELIRTNKLSIVDLAGSERNQRTQTTGTRLKEAGNINNSLMTLGMCLETLRWNQENSTKPPRIVPFRNSKLTGCLQDYFLKEAKVVMMVNLSACGKDYEETNNALKFAAVAKEITTSTRLDTRRNALATPATLKKRKANDLADADAESEEHKRERNRRQEAEKEVESLKQKLGAKDEKDKHSKEEQDKEIKALKKKFVDDEARDRKARNDAEKEKDKVIATLHRALEEQEFLIREEVAQEMAQALCTMESQYRIKLAHELDSLEEVYIKKIDILTRTAEAVDAIPAAPRTPPRQTIVAVDPETATKYQKTILKKEQRIIELESSLQDSIKKVAYLNDRMSAMSNGKDTETAFLRSSLEEEYMDHRLKLEASTKAEIATLQIQIDRLKREKELHLEEIALLKAKNEELTRLLSASSGSKTPKTPKSAKLQKIAKFGIVDQSLAASSSSQTTIWKGDVATSVSGDGLSVTFTDVETLTPHRLSNFNPHSQTLAQSKTTSSSSFNSSSSSLRPSSPIQSPRDPIQTDGLVMKETLSRSSWSDIVITPEEKAKDLKRSQKEKEKDKKTKGKKKTKKDDSDDEEAENTRPELQRNNSSKTLMGVRKLAHIIHRSPHHSNRSTPPPSPLLKTALTSPYRAPASPPVRSFLQASQKSPLSPKDINVVSPPSPSSPSPVKKGKGKVVKGKVSKDKENHEAPAVGVKGKRKLFDKSATEKTKFSELIDDTPIQVSAADKDKRKREMATPIARRLRPRK